MFILRRLSGCHQVESEITLTYVILFALILVAVATARKSRPAHSKTGDTIKVLPHPHHEPDTPPLPEGQFRVATFNVQTGKSLEGKRDIQRAAAAIRQADLIGIQEVYAPSLLNSLGLGISQSQALAQDGNFGWLFCATRRRWLREHRGNALLSKLPIGRWQTELLPDQSRKSYRNMTIAEVHWQGKTFHFINTHLHTTRGREQQLDVVLREFAKHPRAILLGDFNSQADAPLLQSALRNIEITDAIAVAGLDSTEALQVNGHRIDWILTKGFEVHGGKMLDKGVSDHPYYEVTLSTKVN